MTTKEFILYSSWVKEAPEDVLNNLISFCKLPPFIEKRVNKIVIKERVLATMWKESFKLCRLGKTATAYDYYVEMNVEGLNEAKQAVIGWFWQGFLSGRDSKHNGRSLI